MMAPDYETNRSIDRDHGILASCEAGDESFRQGGEGTADYCLSVTLAKLSGGA